MKSITTLFLIAIALATPAPTQSASSQESTSLPTPDNPRLTDAQVQAAIDRGLRAKSLPTPLVFSDTAHDDDATTNCANCNEIQYNANLFTAELRIAILATQARKAGKPFTVADVPDKFRQPFLLIFAMVSRQKDKGQIDPKSVEVYFADRARHPILKPLTHTYQQRDGREKLQPAHFPAENFNTSTFDIEKVRQLATTGVLYLVIKDPLHTQYFKLTPHDLATLS